MRKILALIVIIASVWSCQNPETDLDPINYVNPLIGTGGHGHTYPGACSPFGMVQLSPDSRLEGWDGCSGYHYSDSIIYGFSHTHLSGTGVSDYADVLLMPVTGKANYVNTDYASPFKHENEKAEAGYYKVKLDKHDILAELTTTTRTGMHKYTFANEKDNKVIIDLKHRDIVLSAYLEKVNDSTLRGHRISRAWAQEQHVYFYMQFNQKIDVLEILSAGRVVNSSKFESPEIVASVQFDNIKDKELLVKVGLSSVDADGAQKNLEAENPNWDFEATKRANQDSWRTALNKMQVEDKDAEKKTVFYTALYHNLIVPNTFSDVDGQYRGMDNKIHKTASTQYTIFSLWDTYRATHPLYTIIETERTKEFLETFRNQYNDGGVLPIWELSANYTGCMIGYHSIPVIADAYLKGLTDIPVETLLEMMLTSANQDKLGLKAFKEKGYISIEDDAESVSKTLEYAFDDWCIAQVAKKAGKDSIYEVFIKRAQAYKNLLDPETNCMRPKLNETWKSPFDPSEVDFNYTEANSWQYSFYVPQDVYTFMDFLGGEKPFEKQLDDLFTASSETKGRHQSDITGLIGQYAHGNEPSHHMAYLYNYVNQSAKTQKYITQIIDELYSSQADGLCGNEDCGQMSAWYVFSAMGFYPVNPADGTYVIGKPLFNKLTINLENGKQFTIEKKGDLDKSAMVKAMELNGVKYTKAYINHSDIMNGGHLVFEMSKTEAIQFDNENKPISQIEDHIIIPTPSIRTGERVFRDSTIVSIEAIEGASILMRLNDGKEVEYTEPILVDKITSISMRAVKGEHSSKIVKANFYKIPEGRYIKLNTQYHEQYSAGGTDALIDGLTGTENFRTGAWQGYQFDDFEAIVDLGKKQKITTLEMNFIQDTRSWIWMPPFVEFKGSVDGKNYFPLGKDVNDVEMNDYDVQIKTFETTFYPKAVRYIKIFAKNEHYCPEWHLGAGGKGYIFADEIIIK